MVIRPRHERGTSMTIYGVPSLIGRDAPSFPQSRRGGRRSFGLRMVNSNAKMHLRLLRGSPSADRSRRSTNWHAACIQEGEESAKTRELDVAQGPGSVKDAAKRGKDAAKRSEHGGPILKLLVQPHDGIAPLVAAIKSAKKSIDILIFRLDWKELENALKAASSRGVAVRALIAHTNRGGESKLRALEMRFLEAGITVGRTADDLIRYHGKMMIVDRRTLFLLSFNFVHLDIEHSRGFGIVTKNAKTVQEAVKLFEVDLNRQTYTASLNTFVVSPANARKQLSTFIKQAKKQLLIYDPKIADKEMMRLLEDHAKAGLDVKIIGTIAARSSNLAVSPLTSMRLHTRTIIRDRTHAFVGSQSLRQPELDLRREIGIIIKDLSVVKSLTSS